MTKLQMLREQLIALLTGKDMPVYAPVDVVPDFINVFWIGFYHKYFGASVDFAGIRIPPKPKKGKWRLLVVMTGLTNNSVFEACHRAYGGKCWKHEKLVDLDKVSCANERDPKNGAYAIWVSDIIDSTYLLHRGKTLEQIKRVKTETLLERMLHDLVLFSVSGQHLDAHGLTLCCGSHDSSGHIPEVRYMEDTMSVVLTDTLQAQGYQAFYREVVAD